MISSPVDRKLTRGRRATASSPRPPAAASDSRQASSFMPRSSSSSPPRKSQPAGRTFSPLGEAGASTMSPSRRASSWITTVSDPDGSAAPVKMRTASPRASAAAYGSPAALSPAIRSRPGASADASAHPSIAEAG